MNTNNYLPFDLETALKHPERVVTRDGVKIQQLTKFNLLQQGSSLAGVIENHIATWYESGSHYSTGTSRYDLFLLPEVKECWVNVYETISNGSFAVTVHDSKQEADTYWAKEAEEGRKVYTYIKTIRITNEPE